MEPGPTPALPLAIGRTMNRNPETLITLHRDTARRARRLAGATDDHRTFTAMTDAAAENDADADRLRRSLRTEAEALSHRASAMREPRSRPLRTRPGL